MLFLFVAHGLLRSEETVQTEVGVQGTLVRSDKQQTDVAHALQTPPESTSSSAPSASSRSSSAAPASGWGWAGLKKGLQYAGALVTLALAAQVAVAGGHDRAQLGEHSTALALGGPAALAGPGVAATSAALAPWTGEWLPSSQYVADLGLPTVDLSSELTLAAQTCDDGLAGLSGGELACARGLATRFEAEHPDEASALGRAVEHVLGHGVPAAAAEIAGEFEDQVSAAVSRAEAGDAFGAQDALLGDLLAVSDETNGPPLDGAAAFGGSAELKRIAEWSPEIRDRIRRRAPLLEGDLAKQIKQGGLGNCWWVAGVLSVAENNPAVIHDIFLDKYHRPDGKYRLKLRIRNEEREVTINDEFQYAFLETLPGGKHRGRAKDSSHLWLLLLEKAYAAAAGGYEGLNGGWSGFVMGDLDSAPVAFVKLDNLAGGATVRPLEDNATTIDALYAQLEAASSRGLPARFRQRFDKLVAALPASGAASTHVRPRNLGKMGDTRGSGKSEDVAPTEDGLFAMLSRNGAAASTNSAGEAVGLIGGHAYGVQRAVEVYVDGGVGTVFDVGSTVQWTKHDSDVPLGAKGKVLGYADDGRVLVEFPKGKWNFLPEQLKPVGASGARSGQHARFVVLQNPWGRREPEQNPWRDGAAQWDSEMGRALRAELGHTFGDDGRFVVTFSDFQKWFTHVFAQRSATPVAASRLADERWAEVELSGESDRLFVARAIGAKRDLVAGDGDAADHNLRTIEVERRPPLGGSWVKVAHEVQALIDQHTWGGGVAVFVENAPAGTYRVRFRCGRRYCSSATPETELQVFEPRGRASAAQLARLAVEIEQNAEALVRALERQELLSAWS